MEQVQFVQLEKELVEFLLKFDALVGVFEYALAFGFGKLFQSLTVQFQRFRFADGFFRFGVQHGFQAGDESASGRHIASDTDFAIVERFSGKAVTNHRLILAGTVNFKRTDRFEFDFDAVDLRITEVD